MDTDSSSSPPYSPPSLRHKLRTTVCGCFGSPDSSGAERPQSGGGGQRARWRRRVAATGEFRYDPLSYALNFDEGAGSDDNGGDEAEAYRYKNFSSRLPPSPSPAARRLTAVAIA